MGSILPRSGGQREAFEELSFLLFAREFRSQGVPIRRNGAGGDAGLEGGIADTEGRALFGIQAKLFDKNFGSTQWRDLGNSIQKADNATDGVLREIVVTLPRALTQTQTKKWHTLCTEWGGEAKRLGFQHDVMFSLWDESKLRNLLLTAQNRGVLLYFFDFADFDIPHCCEKTRIAIRALGDRYQPELHTTTGAEAQIHSFLRSERSRQEYLEVARENLQENCPFDYTEIFTKWAKQGAGERHSDNERCTVWLKRNIMISPITVTVSTQRA